MIIAWSSRRLGADPPTSSGGQELRPVDASTVGDRAVHPGQRTGGGHPVGRRNLAVEQWNVALHESFDPGKYIAPNAAGERQSRQPWCDEVEYRVLQCSAAR